MTVDIKLEIANAVNACQLMNDPLRNLCVHKS